MAGGTARREALSAPKGRGIALSGRCRSPLGLLLRRLLALDRHLLDLLALFLGSLRLALDRSKVSDGSLILMPPGAGVPSTGPDRCCTTWVSSCASMRWPDVLSGWYWPDWNTMSLPTVYAWACTDFADSAARLSSCTRTSPKS
jgi:hypothetical protein